MEKCICNGCGTVYEIDFELKQFREDETDAIGDDVYFLGCPHCETDEYLMYLD